MSRPLRGTFCRDCGAVAKRMLAACAGCGSTDVVGAERRPCTQDPCVSHFHHSAGLDVRTDDWKGIEHADWPSQP
jgi:hypothetical protein